MRPLGFTEVDPAQQMDMAQWPALKERLAAIFRTKTRDAWVAFFAGHEVCFAPVLSMSEARAHPHNLARGTFTDVAGAPQPAPAPRFSRSSTVVQGPPVPPGEHTDTALHDWGIDAADVERLKSSGAIA